MRSAMLMTTNLFEHARPDRADLKRARRIGSVQTMEEGLIPRAQPLGPRVGFPK
jgi:hypothetical protein